MNRPRTSAEGSLVIPPMAKRQRVQRFAEFREELTEFSCVCGGLISSNEMAERIERIAARSAT